MDSRDRSSTFEVGRPSRNESAGRKAENLEKRGFGKKTQEKTKVPDEKAASEIPEKRTSPPLQNQTAKAGYCEFISSDSVTRERSTAVNCT